MISTSVFDFSQNGSLGHFADGTNGMKRADKQCKLPPPKYVNENLPRQESGLRPARALPYDLDVDGRLAENGFQLKFDNNGGAGAVFRVAAADAKSGPWAFTVEAGKALSYMLPRNGAYDFSLLGPNGFFRRFKGAGDDDIEAALRFVPSAGTIELAIRNGGQSATFVHTTDAYSTHDRVVLIDPGKTDTTYTRHQRSGNWYDFRIESANGFLRHFAGHIETGGPSISDPLLS